MAISQESDEVNLGYIQNQMRDLEFEMESPIKRITALQKWKKLARIYHSLNKEEVYNLNYNGKTES